MLRLKIYVFMNRFKLVMWLCSLHVCCPSWALRPGLPPADRRMARRQDQQNAARDEYLLNLFRRADQNCTHQVEPAPQNCQQDAWGGQGPAMTARSSQQLMGQPSARPSFNLPGYPAHGPLPVRGNPSSAGSQEPHKVDAAGSGAIQSMLPNEGSILNPAKVWHLPCAKVSAMHGQAGHAQQIKRRASVLGMAGPRRVRCPTSLGWLQRGQSRASLACRSSPRLESRPMQPSGRGYWSTWRPLWRTSTICTA